MTPLKSPYKTPYNIMQDFVLLKYAETIKNLANKVSISPLNYKDKSTLHKKWFVYFWYYQQGDTTKKKFEKAELSLSGNRIQINRIKNHKQKKDHIETLKEVIIYQLRNDPKFILHLIYGENEAKKLYPSVYVSKILDKKQTFVSIRDAFEEVFETKKDLSDKYVSTLRSIKNRFMDYLGESANDSTKLLNKQLVVQFLNEVTDGKSTRTYNNIKTDLKTLLEGLYNLDYIPKNFLDGVKHKRSKAKLNRAFSTEELNLLLTETKKRNYNLYLFICHIYYSLMRPQTIVRILAKDIDLTNNMILTDTKTGKFMKLIPNKMRDIMYNDIDLSTKDPESYLFARGVLFDTWQSKDVYRREFYTQEFKVFKDELFSYDKNISLTSARHKGILDVFNGRFNELKASGESDYKNKAIDYIMPITNHKTREQTKMYLRGISTEIHDDWSGYL